MFWENDWLSAAITSTMTLVGVFLGAYLMYQWGLRSQIKISDYRERQRVFSQLMGIKFMITQLYVSRFEALIYSDFHEARWKLSGHPKESLDLQEAQRWMRKSENLVLEIARNNQELFRIIGLIRSLFPYTAKLGELTDRLYRLKTPKVTRTPPKNSDANQLQSWKTNAIKQLQELVESEYGKPIDALLDYLVPLVRSR